MPGAGLGAGDTGVRTAALLSLLVLCSGRQQSVPSRGSTRTHRPENSMRPHGKERFGHVLHRRVRVSRDPKGAGESGVRMEKRKMLQVMG